MSARPAPRSNVNGRAPTRCCSRVPDDAWATATRCEGWSITDLVAHTCWGTSFEADGLRRARTGADGVAEGDEVGADRTPDVLREQLAANARALVEEIDAFLDVPHDRAVPMPYGALPVALALDVFAMEAGVHTSDLAAALGEDDRLEPDVCRAALTFLHAFGPAMADQGGARLEPGQSVGLRCSQGRVRFVCDDGGLASRRPRRHHDDQRRRQRRRAVRLRSPPDRGRDRRG